MKNAFLKFTTFWAGPPNEILGGICLMPPLSSSSTSSCQSSITLISLMKFCLPFVLCGINEKMISWYRRTLSRYSIPSCLSMVIVHLHVHTHLRATNVVPLHRTSFLSLNSTNNVLILNTTCLLLKCVYLLVIITHIFFTDQESFTVIVQWMVNQILGTDWTSLHLRLCCGVGTY